MSLSLSALAAMVAMRRRHDDNGPEAGSDSAVGRYAKQVAPMVVVSLLTGAGVQLGPMGQDVSGGRAEIQRIAVALTRLEERLSALDTRVSEVSARRSAQVADLEKRVLSCEITQAQHGMAGAKK